MSDERWVWFEDKLKRSPVPESNFREGLYQGSWVALKDIPTGGTFCVYVVGPEQLTQVRMGLSPVSVVELRVLAQGKELDPELLRMQVIAGLGMENVTRDGLDLEVEVVESPEGPPELVRERDEARAFLRRIAMTGGSIVSSASMTAQEIAIARAGNRMFVMPDGYGFVYVPDPRFCAETSHGESKV